MLVEHLQTVSSEDAPGILDRLDNYDYWTANPIRQLADEHPVSSRAGRRARIRLLRKNSGDAALSQLLANEISSVPTDEFRLLHGELRRSDHWDTISEDYWRLLDSDAAEREKLRAATMLSHAKDDARWEEIAPDTIRRLIQQVVEDPFGASIYYELLSPVANQLRDGLVNIFVDRESSTEMRQIAMSCFVDSSLMT